MLSVIILGMIGFWLGGIVGCIIGVGIGIISAVDN